MYDNEKCIVTPIRWKNLAIVVLFLILFSYVLSGGKNPKQFTGLHLYIYLNLAVLWISFLRIGVHYAFCTEHLEMRWFGIPIRKIRWNRVGKATYLHAWKDIILKHSTAAGGVIAVNGYNYEQIIYVTLRGCPPYLPKHEIRLFHNLLHPFRTACIWLPYATKYQYIEAFRQCYPDLIMQPLDDWKTM